ncbi:MAG TPA: branched-chain amino acid ABC transporter permease [Candidatus Saccharimonadales bacterium]|nr:branched-chain amino acid ABC transporter permease [Candidatus Saccharimonadales bacterium]
MIKLNPKITLLLFVLLSFGISSVSNYIDPYFLDVILGIGISIILATSLNLVNGYTGQFSLGHAGFMAVGAYVSSYLTTVLAPKLGISINATSGLAVASVFVPALFAGGIAAGLAGFVVGVPSLRLRGDYLAIVTLGFGEIIRVLLQNVEVVGGARGLNGIPSYTNFFWTFALAGFTVYIVTTMVHSTYGRGFLAVHDDEIAAEAMGVNTTKYKVLAFVVSSFFAGVAGGLYAHFKQYINPDGFNFMRSIEIVVMVILGGMGNTVGVILAAVLLTIMPEVLRPVSDYRMIIYSLLIIVLMLVRPQGLFTLRRQYKEK